MSTHEETKELLNNIMTQVASSQSIDNFEIILDTDKSFGDGFSGQFYKGDVRNKDTGEITSVAIKIIPFDEFNYKGLFTNEILFYQTAYPVLNDLQRGIGDLEPFDNVPKYLCGDFGEKAGYIAMENLKLVGYNMFDKSKCLDEEHLKIIFPIYGKFHALSYVLRKKELEKFEMVTKDFIDQTEAIVGFIKNEMIGTISAAVNALDPEKDKIVYEEIKDFGEHVLETYLKLCTTNGEFKVITHGDCWSNNMLFKYSECGKVLDMKLIDFQLCKASTLIHDLSYFFYSGASKTDMDKLDYYLEMYYNSFSEFAQELGITSDEIFSLSELKNEWKKYALWGVIMGIYLLPMKLVPKDEFVNIMNGNVNGEQKQAPSMEEGFKLWNLRLQEVYTTDSYRERTSGILRHAFEYGMINSNKIVRN